MLDLHAKSLIESELSVVTDTIDYRFIRRESGLYLASMPIIKEALCDLSQYYPDFDNWLERKVYPGIVSGERSILLSFHGNEISGMAITKDTASEKKLCCLRVLPKFQGSGIGVRLFKKSFETLNTDKPLLSISKEKETEFMRVFNYFGFNLEHKYFDYYRRDSYESSFNGLLRDV